MLLTDLTFSELRANEVGINGGLLVLWSYKNCLT